MNRIYKNLCLSQIVMLLWFVNLFAQAPDTLWTKRYGNVYLNGAAGYSVQQTTDGGYIMTGYYDPNGDYTLVWLLKTDANGDTLWTKTFGNPIWGTMNVGYSVRQTTDGGYIIAGRRVVDVVSTDLYLIKTDANGDLLWSKTYDFGRLEAGYSVQQTTDSGYIIVGSTYRPGPNGEYWYAYLIKTDALGNMLWSKIFGDGGDYHSEAFSVQQTTDDGYILTGWIGLSPFCIPEGYLIKTDASGGTLWTKRYGGLYHIARSVQQTTDGSYIIVGYRRDEYGNPMQIWFLKTNAGGDILWTKYLGDYFVNNAGYCVQQTSDGDYIVAGSQSLNGYLVKTDTLGNTLWTKQVGAEGGRQTSLHYVEQTLDGGYIAVGPETGSALPTDLYLVRLAPDIVGIEDSDQQFINNVVDLRVYPNPFRRKTVIHYALSTMHYAEKAEKVPTHYSLLPTIRIYDATGRLVKDFTQLLNYQLPNNQVVWFGDDDLGRKIPAGVYFVRLETGDNKEIEKIILIR